MHATHVVLTSICALVVTGPALAACPVIDAAKTQTALAAKPEFRAGANAQVVRDLRTLRDAAVVLDAYDQEGACKRVVAVLTTLASHPERALEAGDTDEGKAEAVEKARKPRPARP